MSGWQPRARAFDLTATKASWWHRGCACGSPDLAALFTEHLAPAGLRSVRSPSTQVLRLQGDGDGRAVERQIYEALSGHKSMF